MSEAENVAAARLEEEVETARAKAAMNRRYVGTKETAAYIMYDIAQSFNINKYGDIFITDIVKIGLKFQSIVSFVVGIWDIINDMFLAAIVDKTRTRWGKFKPWLIIYAIPGVMLSIFYWTMPLTIGTRAQYDIGKLAIWVFPTSVQAAVIYFSITAPR